jgi:rhodanese-related sulfurtransferase
MGPTNKEVIKVKRISTEVDVQTLYKKTQENKSLTILDVRTVQEFSEGHIPNAINIPLGELEQRISEIEKYKNTELFLVCAVGGRSRQATKKLIQKGFTHAINVAGGTRGWQAKGYPTK